MQQRGQVSVAENTTYGTLMARSHGYPMAHFNVFGVHHSSYKYWKNRPDEQDIKRIALRSQVQGLHNLTHSAAGVRSITTMATHKGFQVGRWLAGKLMTELALVSCH